MKKLFTCIIIITMFVMPFSALTESYMPKEVKITVEETANHSMVILDENQELVSIKNMNERMKHLSHVHSYAYGTCIRGIVDNGTIIRGERGLAPLTKVGDYYFGLTPVDIEVTIFENYKPLVQDILLNLVGTDKITNVTVIAASIWLENSHGAHIFYDETTRREHVGNGYIINQNAWFEIWAGDINLNNELEIGFIPSGGYPKATVELISETATISSNTNININNNTNININNTINTNTSTKVEVRTNSGCTTNNVTVNNGNNNNTTNTNIKVSGNNNTVTTINNTSTTVSLFGININNNSNTVKINNGTQKINLNNKILKDCTPHVPCG